MPRPTHAGLLAAVGLLLAGCATKPPPHVAYYGPTDDLPTLVEKINARNTRLVSLRAEGSFDADLIDPQTKQRTSPPGGDVTLLYTPPHNLRLAGKVFTERAFDIGSNDQRYWMIVPRQDQMFWGEYSAASAGHASRLPIRPDLLVEILGVTPLTDDLLKDPTPTLRFNNDQDCYMLTWQTLLPDRFAVTKEVWYDRVTLLPRLVLLYDAKGRVVLRADPTDPKPVDGYDPPLTMPSRYELLFPDSGSKFLIRLSDLEKSRAGVPSAHTFAFPERPGVSKVESLDR